MIDKIPDTGIDELIRDLIDIYRFYEPSQEITQLPVAEPRPFEATLEDMIVRPEFPIVYSDELSET